MRLLIMSLLSSIFLFSLTLSLYPQEFPGSKEESMRLRRLERQRLRERNRQTEKEKRETTEDFREKERITDRNSKESSNRKKSKKELERESYFKEDDEFRKNYSGKRYYSVGIKGGIASSAMSSDHYDLKAQGTPFVFMSNEFYISAYIALEIDLGYHKSGFYSGDFNYEIEYFALPLMFKYYFSRHIFSPKMYELWVGLGLEARFKTGESGFGTAIKAMDRNEGGIFALGFKAHIYKGLTLTFDFKYYYGITPAIESIYEEEGFLREGLFMFGVSYDIF